MTIRSIKSYTSIFIAKSDSIEFIPLLCSSIPLNIIHGKRWQQQIQAAETNYDVAYSFDIYKLFYVVKYFTSSVLNQL